MLTIKAEIKRSELKVDGTYNVKIRFTLDRKVKRLSTNLFVTQQDLTKSLKFKEDTSIKREVDRLVLYYREQCLKLQLDQNHYSLDEIVEFLNGEQEKQQTINFIKFSREWIASTTIKGAPNYTTAINALVRFIGKEELDINLITLDFLEDFKSFLNKEREIRTKRLMQQGTYSITGWRLGYLIGPAEVIEGARKVHDFLTVGAAAPLQEAAVAGLEMPASYYEELQALYTEKRDHFLAGLDRVGLKHNVPQGTYFVMIDISDFLALPQFKGWTDLQFCEWMIREVGVAAVPGSSFFREPVNHLIRMHFARGTDVLNEAVRRLEKLQALLK